MDFWQAIRTRHAVREFAERDISPELVTRLLNAAVEAPSAGNRQSWRFFVVRDPAMRSALGQAALEQMFLSAAPVVIVVCADPARSASHYQERGRRLYTLLDAAAATQNLLLAATALGLGTCWVGAFEDEEVQRALDLPADLIPVAIVPVGYPATPSQRETSRRPLDEVTTYL